jgi:hypothetical protein
LRELLEPGTALRKELDAMGFTAPAS